MSKAGNNKKITGREARIKTKTEKEMAEEGSACPRASSDCQSMVSSVAAPKVLDGCRQRDELEPGREED